MPIDPGDPGPTVWANLKDAAIAAINASLALKLDATTAAATYSGKADVVYRVADYANPQAAIDACPAGGVVLFPPFNSPVTTALSVTQLITFRGNGAFGSRIFASGCGGVIVAAGVEFHMEDIEVALDVRYTTTTNTLVGIKVNGTTGSRPSNHTYRNVFVDGFKTAFQSGYLWSSNFDNFRCNFGLIGLDIYGLSVNNFVYGGSEINVAAVTGSRCIRFNGCESATDATAVASEGWDVSDSLLFGAEIAVEGLATTHVHIHDNIVDFAMLYGIKIIDNGGFFGGNWDIHDNYIAMSGVSGTAAIGCLNATSNVQNTVNRIHDNHMLTYAGAACTQGVYLYGAYAQSNVRANTFRAFTSGDVVMNCGGNDVVGNVCLSAVTSNIFATGTQVNHVEGNDGTVYLTGGDPNVYAIDAIGHKVYAGLQALTTGTNAWGDRVVNSRPAVGSPKAWSCTVAGTPGTWVSEGNL